MIGKHVGIAGEHLSGHDMASAMSDALGEEVVYNSVSPEAFRGFGFPGAEDLGNMFQFKRDFEETFRQSRDVEASRSLYPGLHDFKSWLAANGSRIPVTAK
jgi:hypothetical protein